jgi:hypothetical protein
MYHPCSIQRILHYFSCIRCSGAMTYLLRKALSVGVLLLSSIQRSSKSCLLLCVQLCAAHYAQFARCWTLLLLLCILLCCLPLPLLPAFLLLLLLPAPLLLLLLVVVVYLTRVAVQCFQIIDS